MSAKMEDIVLVKVDDDEVKILEKEQQNVEKEEIVLVKREYQEEEEEDILTVINEEATNTNLSDVTSIFVHTHTELSNCQDCKGRVQQDEPSTRVTMNITQKRLPKLYVCHDCGKIFSKKRGLTKHTSTHNGTKKCRCPKYKEKLAESLTWDMNTGGPESLMGTQKSGSVEDNVAPKTYECAECGKTFERRCHLQTHLITHTDVRKFQCPTCGKMFKRNHDLNKHAYIHSERKTFICMECGKSFARKGYLQIHKLVHSGVKKFECMHCGKFFARSSDLNKHVLIHTGVRRFECLVCYRTFAQASHLRSHSLIHSKIKRFECFMCGNVFARKSDMNKHMHIHAKENPNELILRGYHKDSPRVVTHRNQKEAPIIHGDQEETPKDSKDLFIHGDLN